MKKIRAIWRALILVFGTLFYLGRILIGSIFKGTNLERALRIRKLWASSMMRMLGVRIQMKGQPIEGPAVYIGNHRTYMDPIIALRDVKALPVAKAEVGSWPLIGYAAKATGIMYVKRESNKSRKDTLFAMLKTLKMGYPVLIYPEGTTDILPTTRPFKKGAFRLAADNGYPVIPVAIDYKDERDAWIGDMTFVPHFLERFGEQHMHVKIHYGEPIYSDDAQVLLTQSKDWIDQQMQQLQSEW